MRVYMVTGKVSRSWCLLNKSASHENPDWKTTGEPGNRKLLLIKTDKEDRLDDENAFIMAKLFGRLLVEEYMPHLRLSLLKSAKNIIITVDCFI